MSININLKSNILISQSCKILINKISDTSCFFNLYLVIQEDPTSQYTHNIRTWNSDSFPQFKGQVLTNWLCEYLVN